MRVALLPAILLALAAPVAAQVRPQVNDSNPRLQTINYKPDQVIELEVAVGYQLMLELASDDPILNVAVGDPSSWQATASKAGDRIYVQALVPNNSTNMSVVTANRRYLFDLVPQGQVTPTTAYAVRFRYASEDSELPEVAQPLGRYKLSGARELQPSAISDDGLRTSIVWPPDAPLPAVFAVDDQGTERVVNGNMRAGVYVVDEIARRLTFRIDKRVARAERVVIQPEKTDASDKDAPSGKSG